MLILKYRRPKGKVDVYVMSILQKFKEAGTKFFGFCLGFFVCFNIHGLVCVYLMMQSLVGDPWGQEALMDSS